MKSILFLTLFTSIGASAGEINLSAGSSAVVNAGEITRVSCEGVADLAPRCTVQSESGYYRVYVGTNRSSFETSIDSAVATIKKLQAVNVCR